MTFLTNIRGVLFALLGGICWGFSGACAQLLFGSYGVDPVWLSSVRMTFAGAVLCLFVFIVKREDFLSIWKSPKDLLWTAAFAIFGLAFCQITYLLAIQYSNAGTATVIQYVGPVMIVFVLCFKGRRLPTSKEVLAMILVVVGTFLLATHGNPTTLVLSPLGLFWGLVSAFAMVLYTLIPTGLIRRHSSITVVACALLIGGLSFSLGLQSWTMIPAFDVQGLLVLFVGLVFLGTIMGFTLYFQAVKEIGAAKASLIASIETVSATVFAVFWLGTSFVWIDFVGFVCIMATVFVLAKPSDTITTKKRTKDIE